MTLGDIHTSHNHYLPDYLSPARSVAISPAPVITPDVVSSRSFHRFRLYRIYDHWPKQITRRVTPAATGTWPPRRRDSGAAAAAPEIRARSAVGSASLSRSTDAVSLRPDVRKYTAKAGDGGCLQRLRRPQTAADVCPGWNPPRVWPVRCLSAPRCENKYLRANLVFRPLAGR